MTYVAGYVYIFQADQSVICVCNQQLYLTSGLYRSLSLSPLARVCH